MGELHECFRRWAPRRPRCAVETGRGRGAGQRTASRGDRGQAGQAAGGRLRRDRGDHELHQHVQPLGDGGRGPACQEGRRARPGGRPLRQDKPRARFARSHRLPADGGPHGATREARLLPRGFRMHDLHRQLRPSGHAGDRGRRRQGQPQRGRGALRKPQLRIANSSACEGELPRLTAARGRLRPRRQRQHRPHQRSRRHDPRWQARDAVGALAFAG